MNTKTDLHRFDIEVSALDAQLKASPPKKGGILFYGSSTMGNWRAK